jgi:hypothetical protein
VGDIDSLRIIIKDFPFPPSSNASRGAFFDKSKNRMIHYNTAVHRKYKKAVADWAWGYVSEIKKASKLLSDALKDQRHLIEINAYFGFDFKELWNSSGEMKANDVSNRIKVAHDLLAGLLQIDDRYFDVGKAQKCYKLAPEPNSVILELRLVKISTMTEVRELLHFKNVVL